jgi:hypothetical protein
MGEALGEGAVISEQEQAFRLSIETADVEESRQMRREKIEDGVPRVRIAPSRNETGRLVQHDVEPPLAVNEFAIDFDVIALRGLDAEVGANSAVNGHAPVRDQSIAVSSRTESGRGEKTVQAHWEVMSDK